MAIGTARKTRPLDCPELHSGDQMTREEFHRIYEQMPANFKAELIGGIVYVASPVKNPYATNRPFLSAVVTAYIGNTPGIEAGANATVFLGDEGEPQPDLYLRILEECGGRSTTTKDEYIEGPPEWIAEIAHSSRAIDLNRKKLDYQRYHVQEYVVMSLKLSFIHKSQPIAEQQVATRPLIAMPLNYYYLQTHASLVFPGFVEDLSNDH